METNPMKDEHSAAKDETYVLMRDPDSNGQYIPVPITVGKRRRRRSIERYGRPYRDNRARSRCFVKLFGQWFFIEPWLVKLCSVTWDRLKLFSITAVASFILGLKLPVLLRFLLEP